MDEQQMDEQQMWEGSTLQSGENAPDVAARLRRAVSFSYASLVFGSQSMQTSTLFEEGTSA